MKLINKQGFTILELLISIGIIAVVSLVIFFALDPLNRFADARNSQRISSVQAISKAISYYAIDNNGQQVPVVDYNLRMLGTASSGCIASCGQKLAVAKFDLARYANSKINNLLARSDTAQAASSSGWVLPTGYEDLGGQWASWPNSYDGSLSTYASNNYGGTGWGQFLGLTLPAPILSDRIRVNLNYTDAYIQEVDIDVYKDGAWVDVYQGGNQATWNNQWVELTFTKGMVSKARVRYNYKVGGYYYWVYELQFYQSASVINLPSCTTQLPTLVQDDAAVLHGIVTDDGGEPDLYKFQYGVNGNLNNDTGWSAASVKTGDVFQKLITGLSPNSQYTFKAQLQNSAGMVDCPTLNFTTQITKTGWIPPSGFSDPDSAWEDEANAYDDNTFTYTRSYHGIGQPQWSSFIYFNYLSVISDKVGFHALGGSEVTQVEVDVLKNGIWTDVYHGSLLDQQWMEPSFEQGVVTQARIRFYTPYANHGFSFEVNEFRLQKYSENTPESCLDLNPYLVPKYLNSIPIDPKLGTLDKTYYAIQKDLNNIITIYSCGAEHGLDIQAANQ